MEKCASRFGGERCAFELGHPSCHMSSDGKLVWGIGDKDLEDDPPAMSYDIHVPDEPDEYEVVNVTQHYSPFSHVVVEKRKKRRPWI